MPAAIATDCHSLREGNALMKEDERQYDRKDGTGLIDWHHFVDILCLQRLEVTQPRRPRGSARQDQEYKRVSADGSDLVKGARYEHHDP